MTSRGRTTQCLTNGEIVSKMTLMIDKIPIIFAKWQQSISLVNFPLLTNYSQKQDTLLIRKEKRKVASEF